MPIFEYRCGDCGRLTEVLVLSKGEAVEPVCGKCGGQNLARVPSRFRVALSEETRLERMADLAALGGVDENDPSSVARFLKKMGQELGEDHPGEVDEIIESEMAGVGREESDGGTEVEEG